MEENKENHGPSTPRLIVPPTPLLKKIGYGTGVHVYHLDRSPLDHKMRSPWALKKLSKQKGGEIGKRLLTEKDILKTLNHPNIIGFRGYTKSEDGRDVLALEACTSSLGDLVEERRENKIQSFSPSEILKVAKGMAEGLHYLHTEARILHGDIKSYNVLVKGTNFKSIKICDFGVSLSVDDKGVVNDREEGEFIGTAAWSAPEILEGTVTTKADIFSLGLTLWEMMTLGVPHLDTTFDDVDTENSILSTDNTFGQRPELPDDLGIRYADIVKVFNMCTEQDPDKRPSAQQLLEILNRIQL